MFYSFTKINIEAPFPTTQCGHSCQTEKLFSYHDHLYARVAGFKSSDFWIIHYSLDLLAFDRKQRDRLQAFLQDAYQDEKIRVITSTTHTHYANSVRDPQYVEYLCDLLAKQTLQMEYREIDDVTTSYQHLPSKAIGKSRISAYEEDNETLGLIRFFTKEDNFFTIIYYNCHPTILEANVPYFSAEYPGYVLNKLEEKYPGTDFTYLQGAAGDISSRFTRDGQDYEALSKLGDKLLQDIAYLYEQEAKKVPLVPQYREIPFKVVNEYTPIDLSMIRSDLSERELQTIRIGQEMREKRQKEANGIFSEPEDELLISVLDLASVQLIFFPREIFSYYMNFLDLNRQLLVSYSNGYGPYVLPPDFAYVTYEMFLDTLSNDSKKQLIGILKNI